MEANGTISTRGLKPDATHYCELIFDVNSAYFDNHGGYELAKQFYADAYKAAVQIVGGEQYILSAVMHADEINRAMTEALVREVYHYHLHVVYVPVVEKQILWSKRCKDKEKQILWSKRCKDKEKQAAHGSMMDVENRRPQRSIKTAGRSRKRERPALHRCFSPRCVRLGTPLIFLLLIFQPVASQILLLAYGL